MFDRLPTLSTRTKHGTAIPLTQTRPGAPFETTRAVVLGDAHHRFPLA